MYSRGIKGSNLDYLPNETSQTVGCSVLYPRFRALVSLQKAYLDFSRTFTQFEAVLA
jgi:hypothetical protein